jgi:hypothetical protein
LQRLLAIADATETLPCPAKREPATEKQVTEAYMAKGSEDWWSDYQAGWLHAERFHGIGKEDKA